MNLVVSPKTEKGHREENQDCFAVSATAFGDLYIVCDGFGGPGRGREAAQTVVRRFPSALNHAHQRGRSAREAMVEAADLANQDLCRQNEHDALAVNRFGTTLVAALETDQGFLIGHLGDSRAYHVQQDRLHCLTRDHSHLADLIFDHGLPVREALNHPKAGILTQALGSHWEAKLELRSTLLQLVPGDALLLCSDGLCGYVENAQIEACLKQVSQPEIAAERLTALALANGSQDNITVLYAAAAMAAPTHLTPPVDIATQPAPPKPAKVQPEQAPQPAATPAPKRRISAPQPGASVANKRTFPTLLVSLAVLFVVLTITMFHLPGRLSLDFSPAPQPTATERVATKTGNDGSEGETNGVQSKPEPTDFDAPAQYAWSQETCPEPLTQQARGILGEIETGMRPTTTMSWDSEQALGEMLAAKMAKKYAGKMNLNPAMNAYLECIVAALKPHLNHPEYTFTIHVIATDEVNAFAMPGGHIYIYQGLIRQTIENEAQMAFVLAHEMIHISERHTVGTEGALEAWADGDNQVINTLVGLIKFPFSMSHEMEADRLAMVVLDKAGYSVFQAVRQMERLQEVHAAVQQNSGQSTSSGLETSVFGVLKNEAEAIFDTHPKYGVRVCHMKNLALFLSQARNNHHYYRGTRNFQTRTCRSKEMY